MGLALDVWNEITFEPAAGLIYKASGEGADKLNKGKTNLLTKSYARVHETCGRRVEGVQIHTRNEILMSSGLGSSAAAIIAGLVGANETLGRPLPGDELLKLATEIEGHPDNVAPALFGGLVVSFTDRHEIVWRRFEIPEWTVVIVKPLVDWQTKTARAVLPKSVSRADAIFNIGRSALVVEAFRQGNPELLQKSMDDRIHQPYRLKHITGGMAAYKTAKRFGAAALSGAGPSIIAFVPQGEAENAKAQIANAFEERGIRTRSLITRPGKRGAHRAQE
jgi:homoserine kinase